MLHGSKEQLHRNHSGQVEASQMGSLAKEITASRKKLIDQGVSSLIASLITDLKSTHLPQKLRALHAIGNLTANKIGVAALQNTFREHGGLPSLIEIMSASSHEQNWGSEELMAGCRAAEAFFYLTRNNAESRQSSIDSGAIESLTAMLGGPNDVPPTVFVLRSLHNIASGSSSGHAASKLLAAGGIQKLVNLLSLLSAASLEQRGQELWLQEILAVLELCVSHCHDVAKHLTDQLWHFCQLLCTCDEPLCLSLALDVVEEIVATNDDGSISNSLAEQGLVGSLVHAVSLKGLGSKAATILAKLCAGDNVLLSILSACLQIEDISYLVRTAALGGQAKDMEAAAPEALLAELLLAKPSTDSEDAVYSMEILVGIVLGESLGPCLKMPRLQQHLIQASSQSPGRLVLRNLSCQYKRQLALAFAHFLPWHWTFISDLGQKSMCAQLVAAFLAEQRSSDHLSETQATQGLINFLEACPAPEVPESSNECSDNLEEMEPPTVNGTTQGIVAFHIGGRECLAPGHIMEHASSAIARTLQAIPDASSAAVLIPDISGIPSERLVKLFEVAIQHAQSQALNVDDSDVLDLWAVAAVLQMEKLLSACESLIQNRLLSSDAYMLQALDLAAKYTNAGSKLNALCAAHLALTLEQGNQLPDLQILPEESYAQLQTALESLLHKRVVDLLSKQEVEHQRPDLYLQANGLQQELSSPAKRYVEGLTKATSFSEWFEDGSATDGSPQTGRSGSVPKHETIPE